MGTQQNFVSIFYNLMWFLFFGVFWVYAIRLCTALGGEHSWHKRNSFTAFWPLQRDFTLEKVATGYSKFRRTPLLQKHN